MRCEYKIFFTTQVLIWILLKLFIKCGPIICNFLYLNYKMAVICGSILLEKPLGLAVGNYNRQFEKESKRAVWIEVLLERLRERMT